MILPSSLAFFSWNGTRTGPTAAVERGPSEGARSGSKGPVWVPFQSLSSCAFCEQRGLLAAPSSSFGSRALREQRRLTGYPSPLHRAECEGRLAGRRQGPRILPDRPQIQLRFPPPQHRLSQGTVHRRLQLWVLLQQRKAPLPHLLEQIAIAHQIRDAKLRHAPLPEPKKLAGPANAEIFLGNHKPVGRSYERVQPLPGRRWRFADRLGLRRSKQHSAGCHQQTIGLVSASPDASAQLVQLR